MVRSPCPGGTFSSCLQNLEDEKLTRAGDSSHIGKEFML
jgi:hypothetical protein